MHSALPVDPAVEAPELRRHWLVRPRGDRRWDVFLRGSGVIGLCLIPIAYFFPELSPLVWLVVVGLPANGPLGPILPAMFEPILMEVAKFRAPIEVAAVGLGVYMYMEYLNYFLFRWVLSLDSLKKVQDKAWVRWAVAQFARFPFATIAIWAVLPLPFWICRCLAIVKKYPLPSFLLATAIGRFPRMYAWAWLGERLMPPRGLLLAIALGSAALVIGWRLVRGKPILPQQEG